MVQFSDGVKAGNIEMTIGGNKLLVGGDIILSFNGIKVEACDKSLLKIANLMEQRVDDAPVQVTVLRAGKIVSLGRLN